MKVYPIIVVAIIFASCGVKKNLTQSKKTQKANFHIYLLMGQSNMAGRGRVQSIDTLVHPRVFMLDKEMHWVLGRDPVHFDKSIAGTGLGLTFGKIMANENSQVRIGLVPCAKGGSSINQWFRDSLHRSTKSYPYNEMINRAKKAMEGGKIKGVLWHQGESDSGTKDRVESYELKFYAMLDSMKNDLGIKDVPIVLGEIGHFQYRKKPLAKAINMKFAQIAEANGLIGLVSAEGLMHKGDSTHFNSDAYRALGIRYARKMIELQSKKD